MWIKHMKHTHLTHMPARSSMPTVTHHGSNKWHMQTRAPCSSHELPAPVILSLVTTHARATHAAWHHCICICTTLSAQHMEMEAGGPLAVLLAEITIRFGCMLARFETLHPMLSRVVACALCVDPGKGRAHVL
jgi:hypothetical protein